MTVSAIIIDDEINLINYLADKLAEFWPELEIVGTAQDGHKGLTLATEAKPDIAFLDIHMPGPSGLKIAEAFPAETKVVFVTAHEEFALDAFQRNALDYILKPVTDLRLRQTITRLQSRFAQRKRLDLQANASSDQSHYLQWLRVGRGKTTRLISITDVIYFKASQKYTVVVTRNDCFEIRSSIKFLEEQLDPSQFWRIHRSLMVRVAQIKSAVRDTRGRYVLTLYDHYDVLRTSQQYGRLFKLM